MSEKFDAERFSDVNRQRCKEWEDGPGFTILETAGAMCGEAGEAANKAKKIRRIELGMRGQDPEDLPKLKNQ